MNLPSIFKTGTSMKNQNPSPGNQQDLFGLGIQVLKIQSRKQPPKSHKKNISTQHIREQAKKIENSTMKSDGKSMQKRSERINQPLPKLSSSKTKRSEMNESKTDSILSRKKIQRTNSSTNKLQSIKQVNPPKKTVLPTKPGKTQNKSIEGKKQIQKQILVKKQPEIKKIGWIQSMAELTNFYIRNQQFQENELTKVGKKKNCEFLEEMETDNFVEGYCATMPNFYTDGDYYDDPQFQIENYCPKSGFKHIDYSVVEISNFQ